MEEIEDFIDQIADGDLTNAGKSFSTMMQDRINVAMDAEKVRLANGIYNEEEQLELDIDQDEDEDLDDDNEEEFEVDDEDEDL